MSPSIVSMMTFLRELEHEISSQHTDNINYRRARNQLQNSIKITL